MAGAGLGGTTRKRLVRARRRGAEPKVEGSVTRSLQDARAQGRKDAEFFSSLRPSRPCGLSPLRIRAARFGPIPGALQRGRVSPGAPSRRSPAPGGGAPARPRRRPSRYSPRRGSRGRPRPPGYLVPVPPLVALECPAARSSARPRAGRARRARAPASTEGRRRRGAAPAARSTAPSTAAKRRDDGPARRLPARRPPAARRPRFP